VASGGGNVAVVASVGGAEGADVTVVTTCVDCVCVLVVRGGVAVDAEEAVEETDDDCDATPAVDGVFVVGLGDDGTRTAGADAGRPVSRIAATAPQAARRIPEKPATTATRRRLPCPESDGGTICVVAASGRVAASRAASRAAPSGGRREGSLTSADIARAASGWFRPLTVASGGGSTSRCILASSAGVGASKGSWPASSR
jgi:hypothetical protein